MNLLKIKSFAKFIIKSIAEFLISKNTNIFYLYLKEKKLV